MKFLLPLFFIFFVTSCYYDKEVDLYPQSLSDCDTADVSYVNDIKPVFTDHCLSCHSNSTASSIGAGIKLEDYNDVKIYSLDGSLYGSVSGNPDYYVMPRDYRLSNCSSLKIKAWVNNGAKNN